MIEPTAGRWRRGPAPILAILLLGSACNAGTAPVGPETPGLAAARGGSPGKPGDGGAGGSGPVTAELHGGMETSAPQQVEVVTDNKNKLELNTGGEASFVMITRFTQTAAADHCTVDPPETDPSLMLSKLIDSFTDGRHFTLKVDRRSLGATSSGHLLSTVWSSASGHFVLTVNDAYVTVNAGGTKFTFHGGEVVVRDRSGSIQEYTSLRCANLDVVTAEIVLQ